MSLNSSPELKIHFEKSGKIEVYPQIESDELKLLLAEPLSEPVDRIVPGEGLDDFSALDHGIALRDEVLLHKEEALDKRALTGLALAKALASHRGISSWQIKTPDLVLTSPNHH